MGDLKPGQKFPTPTPGFGDRVFYETLLRQRPDSAMAQEWYVKSLKIFNNISFDSSTLSSKNLQVCLSWRFVTQRSCTIG